VLFYTLLKEYGAQTWETWFLEKDGWRKLEIHQPANIFNSNMVYRRDSKRVFRFDCWNRKGRINRSHSFYGEEREIVYSFWNENRFSESYFAGESA